MHRQPLGLHLSGSVRRAAVLGRPIGHSLSPVLHRAGYAALGLTSWTYDAIDCGEAELPGLLTSSGAEWAGYSVTMPGKRVALAVADHVTPTAALVGAANTLLRSADGEWTAENTDVAGLAAAIMATGRDDLARGDLARDDLARVVVLGAGGTAQAAVVALAQRGVGTADVLVREPRRADELRATADRAGIVLRIGRFDDGADVVAAADLVVSTLPAHASDFLAAIRSDAPIALVDAVYDPWPTALAQRVEAGGGVAVGGDVVLLHQAVAQFELFTERSAPVDAMAAALADVLRARAGEAAGTSPGPAD